MKRLRKDLVFYHQRLKCDSCFWVNYKMLFRGACCQNSRVKARESMEGVYPCKYYKPATKIAEGFYKTLYKEVFYYGERYKGRNPETHYPKNRYWGGWERTHSQYARPPAERR